MADVLHATRGVPGFHDAMQLALHEASPALRAVQAETLRGYQPNWIAQIDALPDQPLFLIANEFFDALPIHQYQRTQGQWHERLIGLQADHLAFGIAPDPTNGGPGPQFAGEPEGTVVETCPQARPYMATIQHRLHAHGGLALIVDYGGWRSKGDTLQALKSHAFTDPLAEPGRADLTAHVDFEALAAGWAPYRYTTQGAFLIALGIDARAARLAQGLTGAALENHHAAHHRLTNDAEMGSLFKVLALYGPSSPPPPGFA
jgi:SAM-dependent MidA family methyltransferase